MPLKGPVFVAKARGTWDLLMVSRRPPGAEWVTLRVDRNGMLSSTKVLDKMQKK